MLKGSSDGKEGRWGKQGRLEWATDYPFRGVS